MKTRVFFFLAAAVLLAGCAKEMQAPVELQNGEPFVLQVGINNPDPELETEPAQAPTRTYLGDPEEILGVNHYKVYWSNGDKIQVNDKTSDALTGIDANTAKTSFTFTTNGAPASTPSGYNILYPASIYADATHVNLPAVQTYKADGFADGMFPMAGRSADGSDITLSHLCAIVKVSVKRATGGSADTDKLVAVRFKGRNNEKVNGSFEINYATPALAAASGTGEELEVKVAKSQATSTGTAVNYFIVVPAREYTNGFDIIVRDANGHAMTKSKTTKLPVTLEAGKLYTMNEFRFEPTGDDTGIEIASAEDLIAFATNYNNKVYEDLGDDVLVASLTSDITFVDSDDPDTPGSWAAFNATGGIGMKNNLFGATEDYYFNGFFNGGGHTISGLKATVPLFAATGELGHVKALTIDNTCSFTFTHPNTTELDAGAAVGYNKGELKDVDVEADVALSGGSVSQVTALGGLVGRVTVGTVDNCTYSGNLSVPDGFVVTTQKTYIGGLVGSITNAAGKVKNSDFEGTIDFAGTVSSTSTSDPYLRLGGIVGTVNAGTVSSCEAKGTNTKEIIMDNSTAYTATIQNHSRKAYHLAQGGIAGYNAGTVSSCTNGASTKNFVLANATKDGKSDDANSRYYDVGGIVGLNAAGATVSGSINNGIIESRATPRIQKIGGIVGYNKGTVSSSSNSATGDIYITTTNISPYSLRIGEVGGAIGNNEGTVTNIQNAGDISMDRTENAAGVELKFGGVIGITSAAIDGGDGKKISNTGNILDSYNGVTVTTAGLRFGGVVGSAQASVKNVTNSGNIVFQLSLADVMSKLYMGGIIGELRNASEAQISGCENTGEVYFNVNGKTTVSHTDNYVGGIVGWTTGSDVAISGCTNSGWIHGGNSAKVGEGTNGETCYVGGIVAYLDGTSSISSCTNSGIVYNDQFNNEATNPETKSVYNGGIAAYVKGVSGAVISLTNCEHNTGALSPRRGLCGGIVGYAEYVSLSNCNTIGVNFAGSAWYVGGIAGWAVNSTISGCSWTGTTINTSQIRANGGGGIASRIQDTTIDGCSSSATAIQKSGAGSYGGGIVGTSVSGNTIQNCHYNSAIGKVAGTGSFSGTNNVADL